MATGAMVAFTAATQTGDPYVFGAEVSAANPNPGRFDCSELVEWSCGRLGVAPRMPDGSWIQKAHCQRHGTLIPVSEGIDTVGALLFRMSGNPTHVAISDGKGGTIEARGRAYGVGKFTAYGRGWTHAAKIPGVDHHGAMPSLPSKREMAREAWPHVGRMANLDPGDVSLHVIWLQRGLNITSGFGLADDGYFGDRTVLAVAAYQRWLGVTSDEVGHAHEGTRWVLTVGLRNIADGKA